MKKADLPPGLWGKAKLAAEHTPHRRNRAVDLFRAVAIGLVVLGHWFLVAPQIVDGEVRLAVLLVEAPWTQYATWLFQVMPVFFFVGGYANAISWTSVRHDASKRREWASSRLTRLLVPIVPLVLIWACGAAVAKWVGIPIEIIDAASQAALVPVWFLAVYIMITVVVPASVWIWDRIGPVSVLALMAGAITVDMIAFGYKLGWLRWVNYGFIWMAVHQMGFWWQSQRHVTPPWFFIVLVGVIWMVLLIAGFGFPVAMISVPGAEISNTRPPTTAMFAIGCIHIGILLALEVPVKKWLANVSPWAAVIAVNQMIMTVYLWHITVLIVLIGVSLLADGVGLRLSPGTTEWWVLRPIWIALLAAGLIPFVSLFRRFETVGKTEKRMRPGYAQAFLGALLACVGLVVLALNGIGASYALGFNPYAVVLVAVGVWIATGMFPMRR